MSYIHRDWYVNTFPSRTKDIHFTEWHRQLHLFVDSMVFITATATYNKRKECVVEGKNSEDGYNVNTYMWSRFIATEVSLRTCNKSTHRRRSQYFFTWSLMLLHQCLFTCTVCTAYNWHLT